MSPGAGTVLLALAAALGIGLLWRARQGRIRAGDGKDNVFDVFPEGLRHELTERHEDGTRVTLLQLSSTFCAPCRHTRVLLGRLAERTQGLQHVEIDLTHHPEWSTPLGVHTTPTTLVLDHTSGRELFRVSGVPRPNELAGTLAGHLP